LDAGRLNRCGVSHSLRTSDGIAKTEQIIEHAKEEAGRMREEAQAELQRALARRTEQAEEKIAQAEAASRETKMPSYPYSAASL
jgi:hypothetical protein